MNPAEAPRHSRCGVCTRVAVPADVTIRLLGENLEHLPLKPALAYLRAVGASGSDVHLRRSLNVHRKHVEGWLAAGAPLAPAHGEVTRLAPGGPTRWVDKNQADIDLGMQANGLIAARLEAMEDKDLISVARLGQSAARDRMSAEMKGAIRREQERAAIAAGLSE